MQAGTAVREVDPDRRGLRTSHLQARRREFLTRPRSRMLPFQKNRSNRKHTEELGLRINGLQRSSGAWTLPLLLVRFDPSMRARRGIRRVIATCDARTSSRQVRTANEPPASASSRIPDATGRQSSTGLKPQTQPEACRGIEIKDQRIP